MLKTACNPKETQEIAEELVSELLREEKKRNHACVIALSGELGSGKTCFAQGIALALGVTEQVVSPTFILERIYKLQKPPFKHFIHIDCYRLENSSEMKALGWEEMLANPDNVIVVEWAERIEDVIPKDAFTVHFQTTGENERKLTFAKDTLE